MKIPPNKKGYHRYLVFPPMSMSIPMHSNACPDPSIFSRLPSRWSRSPPASSQVRVCIMKPKCKQICINRCRFSHIQYGFVSLYVQLKMRYDR